MLSCNTGGHDVERQLPVACWEACKLQCRIAICNPQIKPKELSSRCVTRKPRQETYQNSLLSHSAGVAKVAVGDYLGIGRTELHVHATACSVSGFNVSPAAVNGVLSF